MARKSKEQEHVQERAKSLSPFTLLEILIREFPAGSCIKRQKAQKYAIDFFTSSDFTGKKPSKDEWNDFWFGWDRLDRPVPYDGDAEVRKYAEDSICGSIDYLERLQYYVKVGKKNLEGSSMGRDAAKERSKEKHRLWQKLANEIWGEPNFKKAGAKTVADEVKKRIGNPSEDNDSAKYSASSETIRKIIKKPANN